ncbi:efflux RND transporter periplasmic adaptor subunit [Desulfopila sp. IMCC35006]|uniref:efflux RND transporter periplasmic adaptor subunit n=1 Tax=Desulfopila sp. IMCC35006 TaxID=2569542 RepID=UPI00197AC0E2|nr:efflux RND transporter periplasmic adaptor subunit [Desulfopila sp. IMCC35006]
MAILTAVPVSARTAQEFSGANTAGPVEQVDPNAIRILLSPEIETTLVAQMAGSIVALNASLGKAVSKGSPLVSFDCREGDAKLSMAEAEFASARETLAAKKQLRQLEAAGDLEVALAAAAANRAKAAVGLSRAQLSQCTVAAPFSGRIVKIYVKPYQGVSSGMPLVEMVNDGPLKIRLNVPSKLLRSLHIGTDFEVDIYETGKTYPARVTAINARVDAVAQTIELEAAIVGQPGELLAGMTGIARIKPGP